jgi:hypothetical protein
MRNIAPLANHRWSAEEESEFTSASNMQKIIDNAAGGDLLAEFSLEKYDKLPFGIIKLSDGTQEYIVAALEEGAEVVEFYILDDNLLVKIYPDNNIAEIDFY